MKILAIGDVVGKAGRKAVASYLPKLKQNLCIDFVVLNGENSAHGFGISRKICDFFFSLGVDAITMGNHTWDQKEIFSFIDTETRLIRPLNYPEHCLGQGFRIFSLGNGKKIGVVQLIGNLFMGSYRNAFLTMDDWLKDFSLGHNVDAVIVDFHAEATSEKVALGHFLNGRVSLIFGTHTHIPTSDYIILNKGTGYISDVGMTGDYDSVIGMDKTEPIHRFLFSQSDGRLLPAEKEATLCGVVVEIDEHTGLCTSIEQLKLGGVLAQKDIL